MAVSYLPTGRGCLLGDPGCRVGSRGIAYGFENHPSGQISYNPKGKMWGNVNMNSSSLPLVAQSPLDRLGTAGPGPLALLSWWSQKTSQSFSLQSQTRGVLKQQRLPSLPCLCALCGASCLKLVLFPQVFHYLSLSILTIFLVEVGFKIFVYRREFFHHKFEVLDGIVVVVSFILDIVLIFREHEFEAVGLLILLRLWRVARIINGGCRARLDLPNFPELSGLYSLLKPKPRRVLLSQSSTCMVFLAGMWLQSGCNFFGAAIICCLCWCNASGARQPGTFSLKNPIISSCTLLLEKDGSF